MEKDALMTVRISAATRDALRRASEDDRRSMSSLAVLILEGWLSERGYLPGRKPQRKAKQGR
jgi:hypothetical protein